MGKLGIDRKFTGESRSFIVGMIISYFVCFVTKSIGLLSRRCTLERNEQKSRKGESAVDLLHSQRVLRDRLSFNLSLGTFLCRFRLFRFQFQLIFILSSKRGLYPIRRFDLVATVLSALAPPLITHLHPKNFREEIGTWHNLNREFDCEGYRLVWLTVT